MNIKSQKIGSLDTLKIENQFCEASISFQGAQVLSYKLKTKDGLSEKLWLSDLNQYQPNKAIRGGIPLCFPWFGKSHISDSHPSHGFARNILWELKEVIESEDSHYLSFELVDNEETREIWPFEFSLIQTIHCGQSLSVEFELENRSNKSFDYAFAWHSYFAVEDIFSTKVEGLQDAEYIDQLNQNKCEIQQVEDIIVGSEIDRIYPKTQGNFIIRSKLNALTYVQTNTNSAVVWNPWIEKSRRLADMRDDAWKEFICVETGNVLPLNSLAPNQKDKFNLTIYV